MLLMGKNSTGGGGTDEVTAMSTLGASGSLLAMVRVAATSPSSRPGVNLRTTLPLCRVTRLAGLETMEKAPACGPLRVAAEITSGS